MKLSNKKASQETGAFFADESLRELREKDFAVFEDRGKIKARLFLANDVSDELGAQERVEAGEDRPDRARPDERILLGPKELHFLVWNGLKKVLSERVVDEKAT